MMWAQCCAPRAAAQPASPSAAPAEPSFDVEAYDVDGNSLLDPPTIEKAVYPLLGPGRSRADIESARQALEEAYHAKGYESVVVELPPQTVADRVVRLRVIETTVGRLRVTGTRFYSVEDVKRGASVITEGAVPNFQKAQTQIAELNREPGRQVTPLVRQGVVPGTVDVDLKVTEQEPLHASIEVNNDHPVDTTWLRTTANIRYDNLWQLGHTLSLSYAVAPQDRAQSEVYAGSYLAPVPHSRWNLLIYGYHSNSNVATIGDVAVLGRGYAIGVRGIGQLPAIGPVTQSLSLGLDFKHFYQQIATSVDNTPATTSAINYMPMNVVYSVQLDTATSSTHASAGVTAGLRTSDTSETVFQVNRAYAHADFIHLNFDLDHTHDLPFGLATNIRLSGQIASGALVSGEQFSVGGLNSVRSYRQSSAVGDNGVFGSLELRSPLISVVPRRLVDDWRAFVFGDAGEAWLIDPLVDQKAAFPLYSVGVGTRFTFMRHLDGSVVVGVPLIGTRGSDADRAFTAFDLKASF